jgi:acetyl esterase/lipase
MRATVRVRSHAGDGDGDGPAAAGESDGEHTIPVLAAMPREDKRPDFQVLVRVQAPTTLRSAPPSTSSRCLTLAAACAVRRTPLTKLKTGTAWPPSPSTTTSMVRGGARIQI